MKKFLLTILLSLFAACLFAQETAAAPVAAEQSAGETFVVPTTAVLPFEARTRAGEQNADGKSIAELVSIALLETGSADLVERAELDKAMNELQLSAVGLVDKNTQLKLGKLIGAKILITGSMFKSGNKNYLVAKIIGTETSRVFGCSVSGKDDFAAMTAELAPKIAKLLEEKGDKLLPAMETDESVYDRLKNTVRGKQRKAYVSVKEDIFVEVPDPAAETELKKLLIQLGFQLVDSKQDADFIVTGEAFAANSGNFHKFTSASARVELSITDKSGNILAVGAARDTLAGASYLIAAKEALAQAALRNAAELFGVMK